MTLTSKYTALIDLVHSLQIDPLDIKEGDSHLRISGVAPSVDAKNKVWDLYNRIDPNYLSEDLSLELTVRNSDSLNEASVNCVDEPFVAVRLGPGVNQAVVAELAHGDRVQILGLTNQNWCLIKVNEQIEGYCYIDYLSL
ncbi:MULTISPECIES: SH3 domain-containing protein [Sphingobacterium]|uniref:SH3 domain-containing protein n=1 Tax=Sphingobacterium populi TaxID=1812824 RepID=A0ABW5UEM1_9SPHI|nr:SH3 domain-containing protein [Sphingobacterium sp. CFCC 11742]